MLKFERMHVHLTLPAAQVLRFTKCKINEPNENTFLVQNLSNFKFFSVKCVCQLLVSAINMISTDCTYKWNEKIYKVQK